MLIMLLMNIFMKTIMTQTVLKYDSNYIKMWHKLYFKMQYFKNCIWKAGRQTDEERSFFCGSLSNCPHQLVLGYSKPVAQNSVWVSHLCGKDLSTWTITCCLSKYTLWDGYTGSGMTGTRPRNSGTGWNCLKWRVNCVSHTCLLSFLSHLFSVIEHFLYLTSSGVSSASEILLLEVHSRKIRW